MPFEIIELPEPVVEPAKEAKTYPIAWLESFQARVPSTTEGTAYFELRAMAMDGERHPKRRREVNIPNIWAAAKAVPEIGQAIAALVAGVAKYEEWLAAQPPENNTP